MTRQPSRSSALVRRASASSWKPWWPPSVRPLAMPWPWRSASRCLA